ncbi:MAG: iron-sulfur cluster assembly scaffold protein [Gammaproteobacteria bacterium]|nr:iron-sulfur cluster assembly scaffold protein [Gammaproteobacteria bacterium]
MMDSELQSLYQRTVLEHCRSPRNFRALDCPDHVARGFNPLCGDKVTVYLREGSAEGLLLCGKAGRAAAPARQAEKDAAAALVAEISFEAAGCAICLASASMMTELLKGAAQSEARQRAEQVLAAFRPEAENSLDGLGDIAALGSVRAYPSRIRCVTLPWRTFTAALDGDTGAVSTE